MRFSCEPTFEFLLYSLNKMIDNFKYDESFLFINKIIYNVGYLIFCPIYCITVISQNRCKFKIQSQKRTIKIFWVYFNPRKDTYAVLE